MRNMSRRQLIYSTASGVLAAMLGEEVAVAYRVDEPDFVRGVAMYYSGHVTGEVWESQQNAIRLRLRELSEMGVSSICLTFPIFTEGWRSSNVYADPQQTPSNIQLTYVIQEAARLGMTTMLKPLLDEQSILETSESTRWRGTIEPDEVDIWFDNYTRLLLNYIDIMHLDACKWIVVGTELNSMEQESFSRYWRGLLQALVPDQAAQQAMMVYSQNWDMAVRRQYPDWFTMLDGIAIDAYFPLKNISSDDASITEVARALDAYRIIPEDLKKRYPDKPILYTEVGVASMSSRPDGYTVFQQPWLWIGSGGSPANMQVQATYAEAACQVYSSWAQEGLADGMWFWRTGIWALDNPEQDNSHEFMGKPAAEIIRQCYSSK